VDRRTVLFAPLLATLPIVAADAQGQTPRPVPARRILAFGDSNTWGWAPRAEGFPTNRMADGQRWGGVLQHALGQGHTVVVDGLVGRTTSLANRAAVGEVAAEGFSGARSLPGAIAVNNPLDLVVLMLGTNDMQAGAEGRPRRGAAETAREIVALAGVVTLSGNAVFSSYPAPRVLLVTPAPLGDTSRTPLSGLFAAAEDPSRELGAALSEAAAAARLPLFDAGRVLQHAAGQDGIHLTVEQHAALGNALAPVVRALLDTSRG
jgi:lysophospholipase L1-like esterase